MPRREKRRFRGGGLRCEGSSRSWFESGLEQEFNSLDAQREACEAYIVSQRHAGWVALANMYDDGGLSGGTMERPALKRLLEDIKAGKVQIVVVYKIDRLTRSLADFAKIVDVLDAHNASFVSVTQQFNTTTSMGRLTLNMLLSFAQFEREIAGERIRDKIAASKKKGMWTGGNVPDPLYRATFPTMCLERDTDREIATTKRGKRIATSVGGTLTGLGGNSIIIDDPLKLGDAMSEAVRARVIEWYRSTPLSRGDDKTTTRIVVVMQRVHQNDLVGYLQWLDRLEQLWTVAALFPKGQDQRRLRAQQKLSDLRRQESELQRSRRQV
jgi:DNA invertase Pin-like site-specific DNA recombinase